MPKPEVKLAQAFSSRDGSLGVVDTFVQNGCFTKEGDKVYVSKRPGTELYWNFGTGTTTQGVTVYNDLIYAMYNDVLYRTGGAIDVGSTGATWTQATQPTWYGRAFFSATVFQGRIYVIGGEASVIRADISYSDDGLTWSTNASAAPFGHRQGHQCVAFNGQMFIIGGFQTDGITGANTNDVWATSDGANWTQVTAAAAWTPRVNFTCVAANNGIYLYGGELNDTSLSDEVWFTTDGATWTLVTNAATGTPRFLNAMFWFQNQIFIVGGYADSAGTTTINDVCSSPDAQTWTVTNGIFPTGKAIMGYTIYNDHMWLIGGDAGGTLVSDVWQSDTTGLFWLLITSAPGFTPRGGSAAVTFQTPVSVNPARYTTMWNLGGNDGATDLQEVWYGSLDLILPLTFTMGPIVTGQPYQFATFLDAAQLLIKNQSNLWVLNSGTLIPVTDTNYPVITVPGLVVLNEFAYVMEPDGTIHACALEDPFHWPSLQIINADYENDAGVAIAKYLNYLVAFGSYTTQFFYDAGNPAPGIALSPYQATNIKIGCAFASTVVSVKNTLIWMAQTRDRDWSIYIFDGLTPKKISTPWVDKVINVNGNSGVKAFSTGMEGHTFYVLRFFSGQALTYDMGTGQWHYWDNAGSFPYTAATSLFFSGGDFWFDDSGLALRASFELFDDNGTPFDLVSQSDEVGDDLQRTFWGQANFYGDMQSGATATLDVSDDDYQTWTTWGTFNLALTRPYINRGGSARRRAFRLTQTDSQPARWDSLKFNVSGGES